MPIPPCNGACGQAGCAAYTCVDKAPQGWTGPFQLYSGPPGQAPSCPTPVSSTVFSAYQSVVQQPAQCSTCTVGAPHDLWCFAEIAAHSDAACASSDATPVFFGVSVCNYYGGLDGASAIGFEAPQAGFVCDTPKVTATLPPATWAAAGVGCAEAAPPQNGCGAAQVCVPIPAAPFTAGHCVEQSGDTTCPQTTYVNRSLYYTGTLDGRGCTACGYEPSAISCAGTAELYSDTACSDQIQVVTDFSGSCLGLTGTPGSTMLTGVTYTGTPSCTPVGGQPTGTLAQTGAVTVCCGP